MSVIFVLAIFVYTMFCELPMAYLLLPSCKKQ